MKQNDIDGLVEKAQCLALEICIQEMSKRDNSPEIKLQAATMVLSFAVDRDEDESGEESWE